MSIMKLAPSILNADFSCLKDILWMLEKNHVDLIHLDVMDGSFVPNITFGSWMVETIKKNTQLPLSVHLMIEKPERFIQSFSKEMNERDTLIIHVEASVHLDRTLQMIIDCGVKAGIALNPSTSLESLDYILSKISTILIMTVNPGFGGQLFIPEMMKKIRLAKKKIQKDYNEINIQVDGGINIKNVLEVKEAGANIFVVGSEIFSSKNPEEVIKKINLILKAF